MLRQLTRVIPETRLEVILRVEETSRKKAPNAGGFGMASGLLLRSFGCRIINTVIIPFEAITDDAKEENKKKVSLFSCLLWCVPASKRLL